jgi:hypothetical protein
MAPALDSSKWPRIGALLSRCPSSDNLQSNFFYASTSVFIIHELKPLRMRLCIYGQFNLDGGLPNGSFGSKLTTAPPSPEPHVGLLCIPVAGHATTTQYLSYEEEGLQLAQGLCTWLSCREKDFQQIRTFELKIFDHSVEKRARDFIDELAISPASQLKSSLDFPTDIGHHKSLNGSLLDFVASLKLKAMTLFQQNEMHSSQDYYNSTSLALSGWPNHPACQALSSWPHVRQSNSNTIWRGLFFGILVGRLQGLMDQDYFIRCDHVGMLDKALCWAYEKVVVDGARQKLIPDAEVVEFLHVYARAEEKWGEYAHAFVLLSISLRFGVKERTQVELRKLRHKVISIFPDALQGLYEANVESSDVLETSSENECSICITHFSVGERVDLVKKCGHWYHSDCIYA